MEKNTLRKIFTNDDFKIERGMLKSEDEEAVITYKALDSKFVEKIEIRVDKRLDFISMRVKYTEMFAQLAEADDQWDIFSLEDYMGNKTTEARVKEDLKRIKKSKKMLIERDGKKYIALNNDEVGVAVQSDIDDVLADKGNPEGIEWAGHAMQVFEEEGFNPASLKKCGYKLSKVKESVTVYRLTIKDETRDFDDEDELKEALSGEIMKILSRKCGDLVGGEYDEKATVAISALLKEYINIGREGNYEGLLKFTGWTVTKVEKEETLF